MNIVILYEDRDLIICEKPPGILSQSNKSTSFDMVNYLKSYCKEKDIKKEVPYIGIVHRLDRPVGGIMAFAKTEQSAKELSRQIREHIIEKSYLAVVTNDLSSELGKDKILLEHYLVKISKNNMSKIVTEKEKNAKKASLYYKVLKVITNPEENGEKLSLVQVDLLTGRHHQIRVQMAAQKGGIWGDIKYNPNYQNKSEKSSIGLYAYRLTIRHPQTNKILEFQKFPNQKPFIWFQ